MTQTICIIETPSKTAATKILQKASLSKIRTLYSNFETYDIILESNFFDEIAEENHLIISQPHPDLLPAFFNLLRPATQENHLVIKSEKLIPLIRFYQNLISNFSLKACEIIFNSEKKCYYGLLSGEPADYKTDDLISMKWFTSSESNIYSF